MASDGLYVSLHSPMTLDADHCYRALSARDARFDGKFYVGVTSTGIYCRPVCPARLPNRKNCRFFRSAAAAESDGFRPCLRCRPELARGSASVDATVALARSARVRIESGALDDAPLASLASELSVSERQIRRAVKQEYGAGPVELAQTHRLLLAKRLLTESDLDMTQVAFCSGFTSVRRFNALFRERYRMTPSDVRRSRSMSSLTGDSFSLTLSFRPPFDWDALLAFLEARAIRGVEAVTGRTYARTVRIGGISGWFSAQESSGGRNELQLVVSTGLAPALSRLVCLARSLFDLDAEPEAIAGHLGDDPDLASLVARQPGLRVPGAADGFELTVRAVLGQQVSVAGASTLAARLIDQFANPLPGVSETGASTGSVQDLPAGLTHWPLEAERLASAPIDEIAGIGIPRKRAECLSEIARRVVTGDLRIGPDEDVDTQTRCRQAISKPPPRHGDHGEDMQPFTSGTACDAYTPHRKPGRGSCHSFG